MPPRPIAVVTSRKAQSNLDEIKIRHADILRGMSEQSQRLAQENQQKEIEQANKQTSDRDYALKQQELATKTYGLSS